jgi:NADPH:quinone reductase-like Zn-dependent oxidoreductase
MVAQQKALRLQSPVGEWKIDDVPVPTPGPGEILVKVHSTALNPVDWKLQKVPRVSGMISQFPATVGFDAAGTVEELGEGVVGFSKGDRV